MLLKIMEVSCTLTQTDYTNLSAEDRELIDKAHDAASNAYAPYSDFKVGSAVRLKNGQIVQGSNQENISYPTGLCGRTGGTFFCGCTISK